MNPWNVLHGMRGLATSRTRPSSPTRQRSPMTAPVTSSPAVVRFSERPASELTAELGGPPVQILARVGVDGLVPAAVVTDVDDLVAGEAHPAVGWRRDRDPQPRRALVDRRRVQVTADVRDDLVHHVDR